MHRCASTLAQENLSLILLYISLSLYLHLFPAISVSSLSPPPSPSPSSSPFHSPSVLQRTKIIQKGKRSERFAVFCLLIEKSPHNFVLITDIKMVTMYTTVYNVSYVHFLPLWRKIRSRIFMRLQTVPALNTAEKILLKYSD
jgi:hypothetical protein